MSDTHDESIVCPFCHGPVTPGAGAKVTVGSPLEWREIYGCKNPSCQAVVSIVQKPLQKSS